MIYLFNMVMFPSNVGLPPGLLITPKVISIVGVVFQGGQLQETATFCHRPYEFQGVSGFPIDDQTFINHQEPYPQSIDSTTIVAM